MQTDKHLYSIFSGNPEWLFELTGRPSPGPCQFESMSFKALELTADGVVVPETVKEAITIVEFQFQQDSTVYVRTVLEMALVQRKSPDRQVQGMILFLDENLDSRSEPWCQIVQSYSLSNLISKLVLT
ncbi:MAG: DUF2887 domain-containing protein, partial [Planctomycetes bacterium]|nr:DUF2887 domain-containing protein [Planctomycetota bacterium]